MCNSSNVGWGVMLKNVDSISSKPSPANPTSQNNIDSNLIPRVATRLLIEKSAWNVPTAEVEKPCSQVNFDNGSGDIPLSLDSVKTHGSTKKEAQTSEEDSLSLYACSASPDREKTPTVLDKGIPTFSIGSDDSCMKDFNQNQNAQEPSKEACIAAVKGQGPVHETEGLDQIIKEESDSREENDTWQLTVPRRFGCHSTSDMQLSFSAGLGKEKRNLYCQSRSSKERKGYLNRKTKLCSNEAKSSCEILRDSLSKLYRMDDFQQEETLGTGYFSTVYKVLHKVTNEVMVLKMNVRQSNRPNTLKEVQLMNQLTHPNIVKYLGVCINEGQLHAVIEYISGGTYHDLLISEAALPWYERAHVAAGIAKGMQYLHSRGYLHRDLTTKNILLRCDSSTTVKYSAVVGDFGLAVKIPDPLRDTRLPPAGSVYWMAPECVLSEFYDEKADLFSFGIVLCQTMARVDADPEQLPRLDKTFGVNLKELLQTLVPGECPLPFYSLAKRCCSIQPEQRPSFSLMVPLLTRLFSQLTSDPGAVLTVAWGQPEERDTSPSELHSAAAAQAAAAAKSSWQHAPESRHRRCRSDDLELEYSPVVVGGDIPESARSGVAPSNNPFRFLLVQGVTDKVVSSWGDVGGYWADPNTPPATPATPVPAGYQSVQEDWGTEGLRRCCSLPEGLPDLPLTPTPSPQNRFFSPPPWTYSKESKDNNRHSRDSDSWESDAGLELSGSLQWCRQQLNVECRRIEEASLTEHQLLSLQSLSPVSATSDLGQSWGYDSGTSATSISSQAADSLPAAKRSSAAAQAAVCLVDGVYQTRKSKVGELKDRYEALQGNKHKVYSPHTAISLGLLSRGQLVRQKLPNYQRGEQAQKPRKSLK